MTRHLRTVGLLLPLSLLLALGAHAQGAPCDTTLLRAQPANVRAWCATDTPPRLLLSNTQAQAVRYPDMMRAANVEGEVLMELTVTDSGTPDRTSLRVRRSSHDLFTGAVKRAISEWRFQPARVGGAAVVSRGLLRVDFLLPPGDSLPLETVLEGPTPLPDGLQVRTGWRTIQYAPPAAIDSSRLFSLIEAIVRKHGRALRDRANCLAWGNDPRDLPANLLEYLDRRGVEVVPPARCPDTYQSMVLQLDSLGRPLQPPPGVLDPHWLTIQTRAWTSDVYLYSYTEGIGTGGTTSTCQATWDAALVRWELACRSVSHWVS